MRTYMKPEEIHIMYTKLEALFKRKGIKLNVRNLHYLENGRVMIIDSPLLSNEIIYDVNKKALIGNKDVKEILPDWDIIAQKLKSQAERYKMKIEPTDGVMPKPDRRKRFFVNFNGIDLSRFENSVTLHVSNSLSLIDSDVKFPLRKKINFSDIVDCIDVENKDIVEDLFKRLIDSGNMRIMINTMNKETSFSCILSRLIYGLDNKLNVEKEKDILNRFFKEFVVPLKELYNIDVNTAILSEKCKIDLTRDIESKTSLNQYKKRFKISLKNENYNEILKQVEKDQEKVNKALGISTSKKTIKNTNNKTVEKKYTNWVNNKELSNRILTYCILKVMLEVGKVKAIEVSELLSKRMKLGGIKYKEAEEILKQLANAGIINRSNHKIAGNIEYSVTNTQRINIILLTTYHPIVEELDKSKVKLMYTIKKAASDYAENVEDYIEEIDRALKLPLMVELLDEDLNKIYLKSGDNFKKYIDIVIKVQNGPKSEKRLREIFSKDYCKI